MYRSKAADRAMRETTADATISGMTTIVRPTTFTLLVMEGARSQSGKVTTVDLISTLGRTPVPRQRQWPMIGSVAIEMGTEEVDEEVVDPTSMPVEATGGTSHLKEDRMAGVSARITMAVINPCRYQL